MLRIHPLSLAMLVGLGACGSSDSAPTEQIPPAPTELNVYLFGQPQMQGPMNAAAAKFEAANNLKVNFVAEPDFTKLQPTLEGKASSRSADFDLYLAGNAWVADFVNLGYAEPLDSYIKADVDSAELGYADIPEGVRKKNSFAGRTYSMLVDNDNMILFYRKDILGDPVWQEAYKNDPANVDHKDLPSPPRTLTEMLDVAKFFNGKDWNPAMADEASFVTSSATLGQSHYYVLSWITPYTVMPAGVAPQQGLLFFKPDMTPLVNTPGFVRGVTEWKAMIDCCTKWYVDSDGPNHLLKREAVIDQMIKGQALMAIDWGDIGPAAFRAESVVQGKLGFAMAPGATTYYDWQKSDWSTLEQPNFAPMHQFNGWALYMASTSKKKDTAWKFMRYFSSPEISLETVADPAGGYQPWRTSHSTNMTYWQSHSWKLEDAQQYAQAILDTTNHPNRVIDIRIPGSFRYEDVMESELKNVVSGAKTPQQAMDDAANEFNDITVDLGKDPETQAYHAHLE